jgi:ABC-2 type transport system ATP-binding protein
VASGLKKSFGDVRAVGGLDITLQRGTIVALLGPHGAGQTTTIEMLIGRTKPDAGAVSLFGRSRQEAVRSGKIGAMTPTLEIA